MSNRYAAHAAFIRPARATPELWRVLAMLVGFEIVFAVAPAMFALAIPGRNLTEQFFEGTTAFGTLAQFFSFIFVAVGFVILLRLLHDRGFWSVVGQADRAVEDLIKVAIGVGGWLLILDVLPILFFLSGGEGAPQMRNLALWVVLIPLTLFVLIIQVSTEELFFRGYLQQQLASLSQMRLVWMVVPSALFGLLHYWNGNGAADGIIWAIWATCLGIACADLTARTGTIGAAIGLHLANNAFALLLVSVEGWPASGVALFVFAYQDPALFAQPAAAVFDADNLIQLASMLIMVVIMWVAARIALRR